MPESTCVSCGTLFLKRRIDSHYCTKACRRRAFDRARSQQPERKAHDSGLRGWRIIRCAWCDHEHRTRSWATSLCCSHQCATNYRNRDATCPVVRPLSTPLTYAVCEWCGASFVTHAKRRVHCLKVDPRRWRSSAIGYGTCQRCSKTFVRFRSQVGAFCSERCTRATRKRNRKHIERTTSRKGERITLKALGDRDGWRCHLCHKRVTSTPGQANLSPSIDHLIPVSQQGTHTWDNVALAHRICNSRRGTQGIAQLRLIA